MSLSSSLGSSAGSAPSRPKVNLRSTAVKRIMQEAAELASEDTMEEDFVAAPLEVRIRRAGMGDYETRRLGCCTW